MSRASRVALALGFGLSWLIALGPAMAPCAGGEAGEALAAAATDVLVDRPFGLADVRAVYVASLGSTEAALRSRALLVDELGSVGFVVAETSESADAVLSGLAVTKSRAGEAVVVLKTAVLKTSSGETLWFTRLRPTGSPARQARRVARGLRENVKEAAWQVARSLGR